MLKSVSTRARQCHEWASKARQHALETTDPVSRDEYLASEVRWLKLAESYELTERLTDFLNKPAAFPKHPECPNCHVPMWLVAIESSCEKVGYLYECKACEEKAIVTEQGRDLGTCWYFRRMDDDLVFAREHVRRGREIVTAQERLIERQRALHFDTTDAECTLGIFISSLKIFEDHYSLLAKKAVPSS